MYDSRTPVIVKGASAAPLCARAAGKQWQDLHHNEYHTNLTGKKQNLK